MIKKMKLRFVQIAIILTGILLVTTSASATSQSYKAVSVYDQASWLIASNDIRVPTDLPVMAQAYFHYPVSYTQNTGAQNTPRFVNNPTPHLESTDFCFEN